MRTDKAPNGRSSSATRLREVQSYERRWALTDHPEEPDNPNIDTRTLNAVQNLVGAGGEVWITVTGRSMEPTLRHGDRVLLRASRSVPRADRVVLSEFKGRVLLHRVIHAGVEAVTTAGDSCRRADPPVPRSAIIAEALAVQTSRGVVPLRPTLRFGVVRLLPYLRATIRQRLRRASWRFIAVLDRMPTNYAR